MKTSGVLMSITSLPSKYGIGTLGEEAYKFVDFLYESKQTYWQILPIGPTSYGDSPYQTFSAFAGNPYFIDLDFLVDEKLLDKSYLENIKCNDDEVDYEEIYKYKIDILKKSFEKFNSNDNDFINFKESNKYWLESYSKFMTLKYMHDGVCWNEWDSKYKDYNKVDLNNQDVEFWNYVQFIFDNQWFKLKKYANDKGVKFIGDMAIYVAYDSADVWEYPKNYLLDENLEMTVVAGCPPDSFSLKGQLWGNPIYDWKYMKKTGYEFWLKRVEQANRLFDLTRIDHFRGFAGFYTIPAGNQDAIKGQWNVGPGYDLFKKIKNKLGNIPIIAEDLGHITPDVKKLLDKTKFPGMKLMLFGFGSDMNNEHLPHNYKSNIVCYAGTHDNPPINGWRNESSEEEKLFAYEYLNTNDDDLVWDMIEFMFKSCADCVIVTMQDLLQLDEKSRTNTPSTLGGNWIWRMEKTAIQSEIINKLNSLSKKYNRN